jgi:antirestriction protein ArdC
MRASARPVDKLPKIETHEHDPIEAAERIIAEMPNRPEIQYTGSKAFYSSLTDRITLPPREVSLAPRNFTRPHYMRRSIVQAVRNALREKGFARPLRSVRPSIPRRSL